MTQKMKTLELARIYENQGYYKDAFEIYSFLDAQETSSEIKTRLTSTQKRMEDTGQKDVPALGPEENISRLFQKWVMLMALKQRLDNFKKIKARLL